jgi:glycosyltransferase involved in cell wall biosynthesis
MKRQLHNVLYLDSGSGIGGGQRSLLLLLKYLDRTRFRPFVGCLGESPLSAEVQKAGVSVIPLNLPAAHDKKDKTRRFTVNDITRDFRQLGVIFQLRQVVKEHNIHLIHANSLATALLGGVVAKLSHLPIVMHKRYATSYGILDRLAEKLLDRVILVSEATRWDFAPESKQVLIYNGVELEGFNVSAGELEATRDRLNLRCDDLVAGIVTRITREKGIHLLIEAMAELRKLPQVKLLIVGGSYFPADAAYMDGLKSRAKKLGVEDRVIFTGFLSDTRTIIALLDLMLVPSIIPEACPRTIIEAMAAGTPVISTPLGGSKELVTPETGILVPPEDSGEFAEAIRSLATDSERRLEMGRAARLRAERFFRVERNTRLTEGVYEGVFRQHIPKTTDSVEN